MIDEVAKAHLHDHLRWVREVLVSKLDGLSEYDIRRPLTTTGTNLLGLVKHSAITNARYFGEVFDRPFPEPIPRWDDRAAWYAAFWATEHETRADLVDFYRRVWSHSDATIEALDLDARGYVTQHAGEVPLFNVMVHCLSEANRHAGHADILREGLDGAVGDAGSPPLHGRDNVFWEAQRALIERAAQAADRIGQGDPSPRPIARS